MQVKDNFEELARECVSSVSRDGYHIEYGHCAAGATIKAVADLLRRVDERARADEREACALIVERGLTSLMRAGYGGNWNALAEGQAKIDTASAIRARGKLLASGQSEAQP